MGEKKKTPGAIVTHMKGNVSSYKKGESIAQSKGPRQYAKGEVTNQVERPPKR